ncbi:MAG: type II secretion system protein [Alphaproteobacteria bacterium]
MGGQTLPPHHCVSKPKSSLGFTLVELGIVLVITGLIIGGVLVGKDLIQATQIRAQVSQIDQIKTAVQTFKLKYNCIPGDCPNATSFFSAGAQPEQVRNGNGNSQVCATGAYGIPIMCDTADTNSSFLFLATEVSSFFDHLAAAGFIPLKQYDETLEASFYPDIAFPSMKFQSSGGDQLTTFYGSKAGIVASYLLSYLHIQAGNKLIMGACGGSGTQHTPAYCGFSGNEAYMIDLKVDDGLPLTGSSVIISYYYLYRVPGDVNDNISACTAAVGQNLYHLTRNGRNCVLAVNLE